MINNIAGKLFDFILKFTLNRLNKRGKYLVYKYGDYCIMQEGYETYDWIFAELNGNPCKEGVMNCFEEAIKNSNITVKFLCDKCHAELDSESDLEYYGGLGEWCYECRNK